MATKTITEQNFADTVKEGLVILDWWAPWCGPCKAFGPVYERTSSKFPDVVFGKVNTEDAPALARQFEINSIPALMVIKDGVLLFSQAGMMPPKALETLVEKATKVDVDELKKQAAAAQ